MWSGVPTTLPDIIAAGLQKPKSASLPRSSKSNCQWNIRQTKIAQILPSTEGHYHQHMDTVTSRQILSSTERYCHWHQPHQGCRGHIPSNILVGRMSMGISPPLLLRTFGYSRPILVVLTQWQHLMVSFIHCFAQKSKICHRIDPNPTEGAHDKAKL